MPGGVANNCNLYWGFCCDPGGEPVKTGWVFILLGVGSAILGQHMEAYVMALALVLVGLMTLRVKGV